MVRHESEKDNHVNKKWTLLHPVFFHSDYSFSNQASSSGIAITVYDSRARSCLEPLKRQKKKEIDSFIVHAPTLPLSTLIFQSLKVHRGSWRLQNPETNVHHTTPFHVQKMAN